VYALEKTAATDLISLKMAARTLNHTANDPTMPKTAVYNLVTDFLMEISQYGVQYYTRGN
ncbi:MAG: hypothetical protein WBO79_04020, partial [Gemmiger qucibialis]